MSEQEYNEILVKVRDMHSLLHGDEDRPGLSPRLKRVENDLYGQNGSWGMKHRNDIMWRGHVWVICTLSGMAGWLGYYVFEKFVKGG